MNYWRLFWTINLLVAGFAFAFITLMVILKGVGDLRDMFVALSQQREKSPVDSMTDRNANS